MKKKTKRRSPFTTRPKKKYSFPVPIPPSSVVSVRRDVGKPWASETGRIFRIGYYSKMDGLDCIWLVDENGGYNQTIDHECLNKFFEIQSLAKDGVFTVGAARSFLDFSGKRGGLNGSTQHSARTHLALKTKAKIAR